MPEEIVVSEQLPEDLALRPVINLEIAKKRLEEFQQFVKFYLVEGEDFGTIPGTPKPTLYKSGADKLCDVYGLADEYTIEDKTEDFDSGLFDYTIKCKLTRKADGVLIATGMGSCSSYESKYRWRERKRSCPQCGKEAIIKGKQEYGGGWLCFGKKGGCGAKFPDGDRRIEAQTTERVQNEDLADQKNTILKMGKKRAKVDAVLSATRSSGIFTQDVIEPEAEMNSEVERATVPHKAEPIRPPKRTQAPTTHAPEPEPEIVQSPKMNRGIVTIAKVEPKLKQPTTAQIAKAKQEGKPEPQNKEYFVITCEDETGNQHPVYVWHESFYKHILGAQGKRCEVEIAKNTKREAGKEPAVFYSLEHIHQIGDVIFVNDAPTTQARGEELFNKE